MTYRTMKMKWHTKDSWGAGAICACCGRSLTGKAMVQVHVINGGSDILHPADEHLYEIDAGDMDYHDIGIGCAKKFKGFTVKWNSDEGKYIPC
jgi:hypothetical protein